MANIDYKEQIKKQIEKIEELKQEGSYSSKFQLWNTKTLSLLNECLEQNLVTIFRNILMSGSYTDANTNRLLYLKHLDEKKEILESLIEYVPESNTIPYTQDEDVFPSDDLEKNESDIIKLIKSKIKAIEENLLKSIELEKIKLIIEKFLDRQLNNESITSLRYRKFRTQTRTLWSDPDGFARNSMEYIEKYLEFFEQYVSEKRIRQRLSDEKLWVESVTQGNEQHIMVGERDNQNGEKVHVVLGETGEIRIDKKDKAPDELFKKVEAILTTKDGRIVKSTLEFFNTQD